VSRIRIGAVSYLNTRPLVFGLEQGIGAARIELCYDVPSALAARMERGELDVGLLPSIELGRIPGLEIVPGLGICTRGPARSVLLVSRRPLAEIRSVALDPQSRTSNALAQVLCADVWSIEPECAVGALEIEEALSTADAAVRIGDKALFEPLPADVEAHDLGSAWTRATGLPFVWAVWAARAGVVDRRLYEDLHDSRREGRRALDAIADDYTWNGRQYPELARAYLQSHILHRFGSPELKGLELFLKSAARLGLIERAPEVRLALQSGACRQETA